MSDSWGYDNSNVIWTGPIVPLNEESETAEGVVLARSLAAGVCANAAVASNAVPAKAAVMYLANMWFSP